jgi:hypothetical protein
MTPRAPAASPHSQASRGLKQAPKHCGQEPDSRYLNKPQLSSRTGLNIILDDIATSILVGSQPHFLLELAFCRYFSLLSSQLPCDCCLAETLKGIACQPSSSFYYEMPLRRIQRARFRPLAQSSSSCSPLIPLNPTSLPVTMPSTFFARPTLTSFASANSRISRHQRQFDTAIT